MQKEKIINEKYLSIYFKKFIKRGQIIFTNENDVDNFKNFLNFLHIERYECFINNGVLFSRPLFFPHYLKENVFSPESCFSFN